MENGKYIELEGIVEEIIYTNDENGYAVLSFMTLEEGITVVGYIPGVYEGESLKLYGNYTTHTEYGEQFKVEFFEKSVPKTKSSILAFLSSGIVKGIRAVTAKKIVDRFGEKTLDIISESPERLSEIKGISFSKAIEIGESYMEKKSITDIIIFLQKYNISINLAMKISRILPDSPITQIENNPYILCDKIDGISFLTADTIAINMGVRKNDVKRIKSGIKYTLKNAALNGHTYLTEDAILEYASRYLEVSELEVQNALIKLVSEFEIIKETEPCEAFFLPLYYEAEKTIASRLMEIENSSSKSLYYKSVYDDVYDINNIKLADMQKKAVEAALKNNITIITGGPGTGKTTVIKSIIAVMEKKGYKVLLTAPTGRAAKRMAEVCDKSAQTIHRLLEVSFSDKGHDKFVKNEKNQIHANMIIVDEMSMVDVQLFSAFLKAVKNTTRLVLVGDVNQLPSVGAGNVLKDIIATDKFSCVYLNEIYRQEKESMIVYNAHSILKGNYPEITGKNSDFFIIKKAGTSSTVDEIVSLYKERLPKFFKDKEDLTIQVLSPMKKTVLGTVNLNNILQSEINPPSKYKEEKNWGVYTFREGDKIIQTKNNYDLEWKTDNMENGIGVFNGDTGEIIKINNKDKTVIVKFYDGKIAKYPFSSLEEIDLAYALTVHKSQGSEFDAVILPLYSGPKNLMYRNLLYTAVTRARSLVVIIGSEAVVKEMIDNDKETKRFTSLKSKIEKYADFYPGTIIL